MIFKFVFRKSICVFTLAFILSTSSVSANKHQFQWQVGEELVYKVNWLFIRLGTLKIQVLDKLTMDGSTVYHTKMFIDSNPLLLFVNIHSVYESYINEDFYPHLFLAEEKIEGVTYWTEYRFNYADSVIYVKMTNTEDTTEVIVKQLPLDERLQDGMSLVFYARGNVHLQKKKKLTAFYEAQKGKLDINIRGKKRKIQIAAINSSLPAYELDGKAHFKAIAGFGGYYRGWFSTDNQRVPLKAEMKVFVGKVKIELEKWKNWDPIQNDK